MQCHLQLLIHLLLYLVPYINTADWKIDTYQKGDNNTVNTHIVSDRETEGMEDSDAEVIEDSEDDEGDSFWDMVVPEAFYNKDGGSNDYSDFSTKASIDESNGEEIKDQVTKKSIHVSAKVAIVASILQKPKKGNNDSFSLGKYKVCKPKGLQKFIEADEKGAVEYKEALKLNMRAYEKDRRKGCSFTIKETARKGRQFFLI